MLSVDQLIQNYQSKKLQLTLSDKTEKLHVINWKAIVGKHEELMEKIEDMEDEEAGEYLMDHESELMQITENFMNDACDEKVEEEKWLPIGLLGVTDISMNWGHTKHTGLLLLDLSKSNTGTTPVIRFYKGKLQTVAASIEELNIQEIK